MQEKIIKNRSHWENWIPARSPAGVTPAIIPSCHTVSSSLHHHPLHAAIFCHCHAVLWGVMFRHKEGWGRDLNALDFNCRKSPKVGISKRISPKTACHRMQQVGCSLTVQSGDLLGMLGTRCRGKEHPSQHQSPLWTKSDCWLLAVTAELSQPAARTPTGARIYLYLPLNVPPATCRTWYSKTQIHLKLHSFVMLTDSKWPRTCGDWNYDFFSNTKQHYPGTARLPRTQKEHTEHKCWHLQHASAVSVLWDSSLERPFLQKLQLWENHSGCQHHQQFYLFPFLIQCLLNPLSKQHNQGGNVSRKVQIRIKRAKKVKM